MSLSYREANTIVQLASSMAGAHLGACAHQPDRCMSLVTTESSKRNRVAERQLIEYLNELTDPASIQPIYGDQDPDEPIDTGSIDEFNAWQDLLACVGLLGAKP